MPTERLMGVTTRLLAGASALTVVGLGLNMRSAWQQSGQSFGPDGTVTAADVHLATRVTMLVFESSYRPMGIQLLIASGLVAAAVAALHRHPGWEQVRRLRWEVLGAGLLVIAVVVGLVLATVYVITTPLEPDGAATGWFGPQPTELIVGNLAAFGASLLSMAVAMLWWLRLGPVPEVDSEESLEGQLAANDPALEQTSRDAPHSVGRVDSSDTETATDYSRDWSPEDFRRPS